MSKGMIVKNGLVLRGKAADVQNDLKAILKEYGEKVTVKEYLELKKRTA